MSEIQYTAGIFTLGCKVNQYESEAIAEELCRGGVCVLPPSEVCDLYIINTCTVTAESERKARQFIRRAVSRNPSAYIIVTGCMAQTSPETASAIAGVDLVIGNARKMEAAHAALQLLKSGKKNPAPIQSVEDIAHASFEPMCITRFERTRAYVKIEDGCESRCTYCIIPDARGKIRSKPMNEVIAEVTALTAGGCREVVLTGIETASYGKDLPDTDLATLLEQVDLIPGIGRVRLGSLDPSLIRPEFVQKIAPLRSLAPHFHLSLQSGSDKILAAMKRKYNSRMAMEAIGLLRQSIPDVKFTTDIIVGFPGESEEDFQKTVDFVEKAGFLNVHVFPYSKRRGTPAAVMPEQIPEQEKSRRVHRLSETAEKVRAALLQEAVDAGRECPVLFESYEAGYAFGHSADFLEIAVPSERPLHSEIFRVKVTHCDKTCCYGKISENQ